MTTNVETRNEYKGLRGFFTQLFSPKEVEKCDNITVPLGNSTPNEHTDGVKIEHSKDSQQNNKKLESYYNRIADILEKNGITIEEAKKAKLLEKLVLSEGINEENFEDIKNALEIALGEVSLRHFGRSVFHAIKELFNDDFDINTLIEEAQKELWDKKTNTSVLGRKHYDTEEKLERRLNKLGCLSVGGSLDKSLKTFVAKSKDGEINKTEVARILIDIANSKDINKAVAVQLIKCLANDDRALAIALMQNIDNLSPEELSKVDLEFVKEIKDIALGTENCLEITDAVTTKSFKEMLKEDLIVAANCMKMQKNEFLEENSNKVRLAKEKAMRGEKLTPEEETYLIYETMYSSSVVGTGQNMNISYQEAENFIKNILNDAHETSKMYNLEFEQDVLSNIVQTINEHPESFSNRSITEFTNILNKVTDGEFSRFVEEYKDNPPYKTRTTEITSKQKENLSCTVDENVSANQIVSKENLNTLTKSSTNTGTAAYTNPIIGTDQTLSNLETQKKKEKETFNTDDVNDCAKHGAAGVKAFFTANSGTKAIKDIFTDLETNNSAFINKAKQLYKSEDANSQIQILKNTGAKGTVLIADSKNKTIRDAERRNIYTNNAYVKLLEKEKERRTKFNPENKRFFEENNNKKSCA